MNKSKAAIVISSIVEKIQLIGGIIYLLSFGLFTIAAIADKELGSGGLLGFCIVMDLLAIALIVFSRKRRRLILDFKNYVTILSNSPDGSIASLAAAAGTSEDVVKKNLEKMIKKKYFVAATIDRQNNQIIFSQKTDPAPFASGAGTQPEQPEMVTVTCNGCGGVNTIPKGQVSECEYCGSSIQG